MPPGGGTTPVPTGRFPVTSGLRFGLDAIQSNAIDGLLQEKLLTSSISPAIFGVCGVLTDPQFQVVIRALNQKKGADLMTAPSVVTRSGQRAKNRRRNILFSSRQFMKIVILRKRYQRQLTKSVLYHQI